MPLISSQSRNIFSQARVAALSSPNLRFRSVDLDVTRRAAGVGLVWVGAANVGDLEHHIGFPVFVPEGDADIGSAVTYSGHQA